MGVSDWARRLSEATVVLLVLTMVIGQLLGQPVLLGFVTSGSMEPTIGTGDGFVSLPTAVVGPVEEGDVVVYRAEEIQGGGLTTHRVVDVTDQGYITRGDANPFTDQDSGEPVVKPEQVVAVAWQFNSQVVVVPQLGTLVEGVRGLLGAVQRQLASLLGAGSLLGTQGLAFLLFGLTAVLYLLDLRMSGGRKRDRKKERDSGTNPRVVVGIMAAALVVAATAAMVAPAGSNQFEIVSAEFESERADVIERGTSDSTTLFLGNGGQIPVVVFLEPGDENIDVQPRQLTIDGGDSRNATLTFTAPPETGRYRYYVTEHRYLALLPTEYIDALHDAHPWLPIVVIDALVGVPFYLLGVTLVGSGRVRRRSRTGPGLTERALSRLK
jgi:signal peptidase